MTNDDRPAFGRALAMLAETLNEPMSPGRIEGYFVALEDLPLDVVRDGMRKAMQTCAEFFPKPGKIRELAVPKRESILNVEMYKPFVPIDRPRLMAPVDMGALATAALRGIEQAADAHRAIEDAARVQSPDDIAARKAVLREQAKRLLMSEPEGEA